MLLISPSLCVATQNLESSLVIPRRIQAEPIVRPEHPWEALGVYCQGSVLKDPSWPRPFRMWHSALGPRRREEQYLGYAESDDGVHFEKPLRSEWGFGDWPETNVLYGRRFNISAPNVHFYHQPREGYRYFLTFDSRIEQHEQRHVPVVLDFKPGDRERLTRHPNCTPDFDWNKFYPPNTGQGRAVYVADSVDGLTWEPPDGRYAIPGMSDGDHPVVWDPVRKLYRMYFRANRVDENGRRIRQVVTATSTDTIEWSAPQLVLESDAIDDPRVNQIHGMLVTYRDGAFIGLIQMMTILEEIVQWHPLTPSERARFHVQLAVSTDGVHFERVADRREFFSPAEYGLWDGGMVRCGGQWVFDGDRMLMYYDGRPYPHMMNEQEKARFGGTHGCSSGVGIGVAASPIDRFAGLRPRQADQPGYAVVAVPNGARGLTLNCDAPEGGEIRFSLRHPDGCRVLGYADEDCLPIRQGGLRVPIAFKTAGHVPPAPRPMHIRLRLAGGATVYAMNEAEA